MSLRPGSDLAGRWVRRATGLVLAVVVLAVLATVFDYQPRLIPLALLTTVWVAVLWLALDVLGDLGPGWDVPVDVAPAAGGQDHRLSMYLRVLEGHLTSNVADEALQDRLRRLTESRLQRTGRSRHGQPGRTGEVDALLGAELVAVLDGPPRRLSVAEIDRCIRRLEEL